MDEIEKLIIANRWLEQLRVVCVCYTTVMPTALLWIENPVEGPMLVGANVMNYSHWLGVN